jgi:hypothetical protein
LHSDAFDRKRDAAMPSCQVSSPALIRIDRSHFLTVAVVVTGFNLTAGKARLLAETAILDCIGRQSAFLCNLHHQDSFRQTASHVDRHKPISIARSVAMPIHVLTEQLRSFAEIASRLPALRGGKAVNPSTVWRWTTRGVRARNGVLIRLESIKVGGTCCTSDEALLRFFHALSVDDAQHLAPAPIHLQSDGPAREEAQPERSR